mmetsp:Transcript_12341/g.31314  ORF Transcript_12341/g.31314 Transcript_12341/m.31314 type:complete len:270 (+) Transcript_12341:111-920(+)
MNPPSAGDPHTVAVTDELSMIDSRLLIVFLTSVLSTLASALSVLPFALGFASNFSQNVLGTANASAVGFMISASCGLIVEAIEASLHAALVGILLGWIFSHTCKTFFQDHVNANSMVNAKDASKILLVMTVLFAHSFAEGVAMGMSFGGTGKMGLYISFAMAIHNVPEGFALALVLLPRGFSVKRTALWAIISSAPQMLLCAPAFLFVESFSGFLPYGLGFAAGAMSHVSLNELLQDALHQTSPKRVLLSFGGSFLFMYCAQLIVHPSS